VGVGKKMKQQYFLNKAVNYSLVVSNKDPQLQEFHKPLYFTEELPTH